MRENIQMYYILKFSVFHKFDIAESNIFYIIFFTFQVVSEIRCRLDFSTTFKPVLSSTPHQTVQRNRDKR